MRKLRSIHLARPAMLALLLAACLFASGTALAQDHGHGDDPHHDDHGHAAEQHAADDPHAHGDAHGSDHGAHGDGHEEHHSSSPHMKNLVVVLAETISPEAGHFAQEYVNQIFAFIVITLVSIFFISVSRNLSSTNPSRAQVLAEMLIGGLFSLVHSIIGPTARRYVPFLGTLFLFIWFNNLFGLIPGMHSATSSFNTSTFALGAMTFIFVQFWAIRLNGLGGYLHHLAGSPKTAMDWGFVILMFPLHVLGELIKPVSLGLRLFGNIFGEETLVATMVILGYMITQGIFGETVATYLPGMPLQLPFYFLGLLSSTIQALVFTLLATVYIALWLPHDDHHHEEAHGH